MQLLKTSVRVFLCSKTEINFSIRRATPLYPVMHLKRNPSSLEKSEHGLWTLKGIVSNLRYTEKVEKEKLLAIQEDLGRPNATYAAFIPIRKSQAWWNLAQDERRKIMEESSKHTHIGMKYLPAIARKLFYSRDGNLLIF